jgi:hypothetical protein
MVPAAIEATNKSALILDAACRRRQTKRRAERWGYEARVIREQSEAGPGINICNYDRLDKIDPAAFDIVSLDEASILKSFTGKTTRALIEAHKGASVQACGDRHAGAERSHGARQLCRVSRGHGRERNAVAVLHQRHVDGLAGMAAQGPRRHSVLGLDGVMGADGGEAVRPWRQR